jgi:hypothetical protein
MGMKRKMQMEKLRHDAQTPRRVQQEKGKLEKEKDTHTWPCGTKRQDCTLLLSSSLLGPLGRVRNASGALSRSLIPGTTGVCAASVDLGPSWPLH